MIKPDSKGLVFITFVDNCRKRSLVITWFLFRFYLRTATEDCFPNQGFCFDFHFSQVLFMNFLQLNNPTYDIYLKRFVDTNLFMYIFNKVIECLQSVAEKPRCALRSRKLFFFLQFCALPFFDILTQRTKDTDVYSIHHHPI